MTSGSSVTDLASARQAVVWSAQRLVSGNVLSLSHHGNISARIPGTDRFVLTSRGTLDDTKAEELAVLDLNGNLVEGDMDATSHEIIQMHAAVYRRNSDLGAVIHTHSPHVTAFALASKPIEPAYEAMIRFDITETVPVSKYAPRGSERSVQNIVDAMGPRTKAVLLENHGSLVFDRTIESTTHLVFILEEAAQLTLSATALGGVKPIPPEMISEAHRRRDEFATRGMIRAGGNAN